MIDPVGLEAPSAPAPSTALDADERDALSRGIAVSLAASVGALAPSEVRRWWRVVATEDFDAWLIDWPTAGTVSAHDHGGAAASLYVVRGALTETLIDRRSGRTETTTVPAGAVHRVGADAVHDVTNLAPERATSLHVYSPPLRAMGRYGDTGELLRVDTIDPEPTLWSVEL